MIEVKNLYKSYGNKKFPVLKDIHMQVEKGKIHGLIGHNGSGKTTLIKCLTGIYAPDSGKILVGGETVYDNPKVKEKIGYVADSNQFFVGYKVIQLAKFYEKMYPGFLMKDFFEYNRIFMVNPEKRIRQLSKGQQMRVAFMLNLSMNPEILILDEPTSGLDAVAKHDLLNILVSFVEQNGTTVIISSHHLLELEKVCDTMTVLKNGRVEVEDEIENVKARVQKYQVVFPGGAPKAFYELPQMLHISNVGSVYTVTLQDSEMDFISIAEGMGAVLAEPMQVDLEEMFIHMNKGGMRHDQHNSI